MFRKEDGDGRNTLSPTSCNSQPDGVSTSIHWMLCYALDGISFIVKSVF